jgi:selenocysteine lyase/cysteine desulfurase
MVERALLEAPVDVVRAPDTALREANLDVAATTPATPTVVARVLEVLPWYGSVNRGSGVRSRVTSEIYEDARATVHRLIGARADQAVIFVRAATDAINKVARKLLTQDGAGTVVVTTEAEHHANLLPWRWLDVRHVGLLPDGTPDTDHLAALCQEHRGNLRLVSVSGASNVTGHVPDLPLWARLAHEAGAELFVDGAQLAPHRALELAAMGIDHMAFSGHKIYAPFGSGVLVSPVDFIEGGPPDIWGGGAVADVSLDVIEWNCAPGRDEAGSPNVLGAVALATALETLHEIGFDRLQAHDDALIAQMEAELASVPGLSRPPTPAGDRVGVTAFAFAGFPVRDLARLLADDHGVSVRAGRFCAHPLTRHLLGQMGLPVDGGLVRVSFGGSTNGWEVERLGQALRAVAADLPETAVRYSDSAG